MADAEAVDMRLWGKERGLGGARYPVVCHGLDAAAAVRALWTQFVAPGLRRRLAEAVGLDESQTCALLEFWASLHDIGKLIPSFAHQLEMPPEFGAPCGIRLGHDEAAHLWLPSGLESLGYAHRSARSAGRLVAQLLGGHHGRFHDIGSSRLRPERLTSAGLGQESIWETERAAMTRVLSEVLAPTAPHRLPVREAALTAGLVVLADWLVSQTGFVRAQLPRVPASGDVASLRAFFEGSLEPTADVVQRAGLSRLQLLPGNFGEEFPGLLPTPRRSASASRQVRRGWPDFDTDAAERLAMQAA